MFTFKQRYPTALKGRPLDMLAKGTNRITFGLVMSLALYKGVVFLRNAPIKLFLYIYISLSLSLIPRLCIHLRFILPPNIPLLQMSNHTGVNMTVDLCGNLRFSKKSGL